MSGVKNASIGRTIIYASIIAASEQSKPHTMIIAAKEKKAMNFKLSQGDFGTLCICAIRYAQGRRTYMPKLVQGIIREHFEELSDSVISVMIDDCDFQESMNLYGDPDIDKPNWIKWREDLLKEQERRNNDTTRSN